MTEKEKAEFIVKWLRERNNAWLMKKLDSQKVSEREQMVAELAELLRGWS